MPNKFPVWEAEWTKLESQGTGHDILRVKGSAFAAVPVTGRKNAARFSVFNVKDRVELTQLTKKEVGPWLAKKARDEGVKPSGYLDAATRIAPRKSGIVTPQIAPPRKARTFGGQLIRTDKKGDYIWAEDGSKAYLEYASKEGYRKRPKNPRRRRNPVGSQRRAVKLYMDFHGENPRHVDEHFIDVPENAVMVGMVTGVMYQARVDGKLVEYVHEFSGKSRPILAASADGKQLLFLDGDYDFTDRGIIDGTATIN